MFHLAEMVGSGKSHTMALLVQQLAEVDITFWHVFFQPFLQVLKQIPKDDSLYLTF